MSDGTVHFRNDIYKHDDAPAKPFMVSLDRPLGVAALSRGAFSLPIRRARNLRRRVVSG